MRKKIHGILLTILSSCAFVAISCGCGGKNDKLVVDDENLTETSEVPGTEAEIPMKEVTVGNKTYNVADITDESHIYKQNVNRDKCINVISKREFRLYVYECGSDTTLAASFPVCYAKRPGPKTKEGDMSTPECNDLNDPFTISEVKNASDWEHDFGDGRGSLKAYGDWFIRLKLKGSLANNRSIGIHGSTNNAESVPGRDSEGCIRLRDTDIITFHDLYAQVGQKVLIKGVGKKKLPFEVKAEKALGDKYVAPKAGNKLSDNDNATGNGSEFEEDYPTDNNQALEGEEG